jgi:multimeric flavodoxin WrbA
MKKIVCVHGGPRKNGNTRAVTALVVEAARQQGAEVAEIDATTLEFKVPGCLGCQKCQKSEEFVCSLGDPVAQAVATLPAYDTIVLSTPLYWWSYTAQLKIVVDRMYSLCKFGAAGEARMSLAGKKLALVATAGGPIEDNLALLESQLKNPAAMMGCSFASCLFANVSAAPGTLTDDPAVAEKAREFGRVLAG